MKKLNNLDYENLYSGGGFSYVYAIFDQQCGKILGTQKKL
jgi:hypothetical protein